MAIKGLSPVSGLTLKNEIRDLFQRNVGKPVSITTTMGLIEGQLEAVTDGMATVQTESQVVHVLLDKMIFFSFG